MSAPDFFSRYETRNFVCSSLDNSCQFFGRETGIGLLIRPPSRDVSRCEGAPLNIEHEAARIIGNRSVWIIRLEWSLRITWRIMLFLSICGKYSAPRLSHHGTRNVPHGSEPRGIHCPRKAFFTQRVDFASVHIPRKGQARPGRLNHVGRDAIVQDVAKQLPACAFVHPGCPPIWTGETGSRVSSCAALVSRLSASSVSIW